MVHSPKVQREQVMSPPLIHITDAPVTTPKHTPPPPVICNGNSGDNSNSGCAKEIPIKVQIPSSLIGGPLSK